MKGTTVIPTLSLYRRCASLPWPKSYLGKFLLIAFFGVHVPLIAITLYIVTTTYAWSSSLPILLVCLVATLFGTCTTIVIQRRLLEPILLTSRALDHYVQERKIPDLPLNFTDEAGRLMQRAQECISHLDQLLGLKNDLLAVISHDTRAPVANIVLASQMINELLDDPTCAAEVRDLNNQIQQMAHRQITLMNNLLLLARADAGVIAVQESDVVLEELLSTVTATYQLSAEQKGVSLRLQPAQELDMQVSIDAAKTEQVLNNLVHNAIKFTPCGGTIELGAKLQDQLLTLYVRDTGTGMDEAVRTQLFSPFAQERRYGTAGEPGTGLGLWICKTFTELQGGQIQVSSQSGQGTAFDVHLPLRSRPYPRQLLAEFV